MQFKMFVQQNIFSSRFQNSELLGSLLVISQFMVYTYVQCTHGELLFNPNLKNLYLKTNQLDVKHMYDQENQNRTLFENIYRVLKP